MMSTFPLGRLRVRRSGYIEELERSDHPLARLLAVRAGRLPQGAAQPGPALPA
jgi:hypothetical protein